MKTAIATGVAFLALALVASAQSLFNPPQAFLGGDAYTRYQAVPDGLMVLDVSLSPDGTIVGIDPLRNVGNGLDAAKKKIETWKFQPALQGSTPQASHIIVALVYRPSGATTPAVSSSFTPVIPKTASGGYVPPGIVSFVYQDYPQDSIEFGSVVIQASLDATGAVADVDYLRRWTPFDPLALAALKKWKFQPATLNGKPAPSKIIVAFLFE